MDALGLASPSPAPRQRVVVVPDVTNKIGRVRAHARLAGLEDPRARAVVADGSAGELPVFIGGSLLASRVVRVYDRPNGTRAMTFLGDNYRDEMFGAIVREMPLTGYNDIGIHSTRTHFTIYSSDGSLVSITPRELAVVIANIGIPNSLPLLLIGCHSGITETNAAQELANALGREVVAPSREAVAVWGSPPTTPGVWRRFLPQPTG